MQTLTACILQFKNINEFKNKWKAAAQHTLLLDKIARPKLTVRE